MAVSIGDHIWHLGRLNFFPELTSDQKDVVSRTSRHLTFAKGESIYLPGDLAQYVYVVEEGIVRLVRESPTGGFIVLDILNSGDIFGEMALAGLDRQSESAEAMRDCQLWAIPVSLFIDIVERNGAMALQITRLIGFRRRQIENKISTLLCAVPLRLARLILSLADRYPGRTSAGKRTIALRLTHQDLGELIGSNREIVTNTLLKFRQSGLIELNKGTIVLVDEPQISQAAKEQIQA
ncbi:MAG TPA: Crp/Fnr family transcriptional regulator [Capsulimonadaceae bacterium]|jgi:CRP-like cAMP-binding protein